ncbi:uncharacterized protein METZ01_LOCUS147057 [marine metagenome]|uniref:Uncharacterized protein n=1 Tax=marine metagenome TaxID=408172 RepID=A0A381ZZR6_9ZZZZ
MEQGNIYSSRILDEVLKNLVYGRSRLEYLLAQFVEDVDSAIDQYGVTVEMQWSLGAKLQRLVQEGGDLIA